MGGKKSRNKGANFERAIATRLRQWLGEDWEVKRNPTDRQNGKAGAGEFEIVGPHQFPYAIECKAHESFDYGQLFRNPVTGPFLGFWEQAVEQAASAEKDPMLILKRNSGPVLVALKPGAVTYELSNKEGGSVLRIRGVCHVFPLEDLLALSPLVLWPG